MIFFLICPGADAGEEWQQIKDKHFVVYFQKAADKNIAQTLLQKAEVYYKKIGDRIGYARYADFWTWEERVKILLFPDQESFVAATGQPQWSLGYSDRDSRLFKSRTIVTYPQESGFLDGLLPHEISHLIIFDFIPGRALVPLWFEEGLAQLEETDKGAQADRIMHTLAGRGQYLDFDALTRWDVRQERDQLKVEIFYAQSLSIIRFMIKKYGNDAFQRLCRQLREGDALTTALRKAYGGQLDSLADLEKQWFNAVR